MEKEVTVERVSEFGVMAENKWINGDKKTPLTFKKDLHNGDVVKLTLNDAGFITAYALVTEAPKKAFTGKRPFVGGSSMTPEREAKINRAASIKAVLELPNVHRCFEEKSDQEAMKYAVELADMVAYYIEHGSK